MNRSLKKLNQITGKQKKLILGMMSGTSQDGVDLVLCHITGSGNQTDLQTIDFKTIAYPDAIKDVLSEISYKQVTSLETVTLMNTLLGNFYAQCVLELLDTSELTPDDIDLIASHGQTIYHAPSFSFGEKKINATLQIGDGDLLARKTGIITISDFRQKEIAAGGEGAPISGYAESVLFRDADSHRLLINIGGISNGTFLPKEGSDLKMLSTDFGPGNTLIDAAVKRHYDELEYDADGAIAESGEVNQELLEYMMDHPFLRTVFPKSTGQETFNMEWVDDCIEEIALDISADDLIATLTRFTIDSIAYSVVMIQEVMKVEIDEIFLSGGGVHNKTLLDRLRKFLDTITVAKTGKLGIDPDAKEAMLIAVLANETVSGEGFRREDGIPFSMGKISLPV